MSLIDKNLKFVDFKNKKTDQGVLCTHAEVNNRLSRKNRLRQNRQGKKTIFTLHVVSPISMHYEWNVCV
jgi:hypothetical protein